jgi:rhodanese-related sulfurtransferase
MRGKILTLLFLISFFGLSAYAAEMSPETIPGATTISATEAKKLFDEGIPFVDVRKNSDWEAGRVPEAYHIELKKVFSESELGKVVKTDEPFVIYCNGPKCMRSSRASAMAVKWGFSKVHYFRDGFPAWKAAEFPVE